MLSNILRALLFPWSGLPIDPMLRRKTAEMGEYRSLIGTDLCSWQSRSTVNVAFFKSFFTQFYLAGRYGIPYMKRSREGDSFKG